MASHTHPKKTHFGYQEVLETEKVNLVEGVFRRVAQNYDIMNDCMSFGLHRAWKHFMIQEANVRKGHVILDVASGTGDIAKALAKQVGNTGKVIMTDINDAMLAIGRDRLTDAGFLNNIDYALADAEQLPFHDNTFDRLTIAFGLRNVTDKAKALNSFYRVLKPGGKLLILEFSHPESPLLNKLYDFYSFNFIPLMGKLIANDKASYQYLVESIRMHPDQESLKAMMLESSFADVDYFNFNGGIVALHIGYKY